MGARRDTVRRSRIRNRGDVQNGTFHYYALMASRHFQISK